MLDFRLVERLCNEKFWLGTFELIWKTLLSNLNSVFWFVPNINAEEFSTLIVPLDTIYPSAGSTCRKLWASFNVPSSATSVSAWLAGALNLNPGTLATLNPTLIGSDMPEST